MVTSILVSDFKPIRLRGNRFQKAKITPEESIHNIAEIYGGLYSRAETAYCRGCSTSWNLSEYDQSNLGSVFCSACYGESVVVTSIRVYK